jgi:hypothetical protein
MGIYTLIKRILYMAVGSRERVRWVVLDINTDGTWTRRPLQSLLLRLLLGHSRSWPLLDV